MKANLIAVHLTNGDVGKVHELRDEYIYSCGMSVYRSDVDTIAHPTCLSCIASKDGT